MPKRITIVEDEPAIAEILEYNLEQAGFEVEVLREGDLAIAAIRRRVPDLILLDLMLPGLDGLELAARDRRRRGAAGGRRSRDPRRGAGRRGARDPRPLGQPSRR